MKKALALLLALVMCLSLAACGNSEPTPPEVPEGLEFCVDGVWTNSYYQLELFPDGYAKYGEYSTRIDVYYWRNLGLVEERDGIVCAQVEIYSDGEDKTTSEDEATFTATFYSDPTRYNWVEIEGQKLYTAEDSNKYGLYFPGEWPRSAEFCIGEWKNFLNQEDSIVINADGSCIISGQECIWTYDYGDEYFCYLNIFEPDGGKYTISFSNSLSVTVSVGDDKKTYFRSDVLPNISDIAGDWYAKDTWDNTVLLTVNEDGTCTAGDKTYYLDLESRNKSQNNYIIMDESGMKVGWLHHPIIETEENQPHLYINDFWQGDVMNANTFTPIEITMDNWKEYLTVDYTFDMRHNDFDELTSAFINPVVKVKDEYQDLFIACDIALEYDSTTAGMNKCVWEYSVETKEWTMTILDETWESSAGASISTTTISATQSRGLAVPNTNMGWSGKWNEGNTIYQVVCANVNTDNYNILRIQGTLVLANE